VKISRRDFLGTSAALAGGAFVIGFHLHTAAQDSPGAAGATANPFDAWVHVKPDSSAELVLAQSEMGQGVHIFPSCRRGSRPDWERVTIVQSNFTKGTGGRAALTDFPPRPRRGPGALCHDRRGARVLKVPEWNALQPRRSVAHTFERAAMANCWEARCMPLPDAKTVKLKEPSKFRLIAGRHLIATSRPPHGHGASLTCSSSMVYAVISRCPTFGGSPARFDVRPKRLPFPEFSRCSKSARGHRVFTAGGRVVIIDAGRDEQKEVEIT
jgi:isoquinoline 1-oxidoreductase beta subunit